MAGIGFELRSLLQAGRPGATAYAYVLGSAIALGPFLCSVFCLAGIALWSPATVLDSDKQAFTGAVVHMFGLSLVLSGTLQVVLTRYYADCIYRGREQAVVDGVFPVLTVTAVVVGLGAWALVSRTEATGLTRTLIWATCVTLGLVWQSLVMVAAAGGHRASVSCFVVGTAISLVAALVLSRVRGLDGLVGGYAIGQVYVLASLLRWLFLEAGAPGRWDWSPLGYCRRYPALLAIGFLLVFGVWIDKWIFWTSELATDALGFVTAPEYDSSTFLGFISVLPAMAIFYVRIEANFSECFRRFLDAVFFHQPYDCIATRADAVRTEVWNGLLETVKIQAVVTVFAAYFGPEILRFFGLPLSQVGIYRLSVVGSFFYAIMTFAVVALLYLDRRREVFFISLCFAAANLLGSKASVSMGYASYGLGFASASLIALLTALAFAGYHLQNLEFVVFVQTPVVGQRGPSPALRAGRGRGYGRYHPLAGRRGNCSAVLGGKREC